MGRRLQPVEKKAPPKKKEVDQVAVLKERLAKGHRLNDEELAQLELAAVARWHDLQREDEAEAQKARERAAEFERQRELQIQQELRQLKSVATAERVNPKRADRTVSDELRELRELRDAAARDREMLDEAVSRELEELRQLQVQRVSQRQEMEARHAAERAALLRKLL